MEIGPFQLVVIGLATWRVSSLFANEEGPFQIFSHIRHALGEQYVNGQRIATTHVGKGLACQWCNTVWFAFIWILIILIDPFFIYAAMIFAVSTLAIIVEEAITRIEGP